MLESRGQYRVLTLAMDRPPASREATRGVSPRGSLSVALQQTSEDPAELWRHYMQLTEIEQTFKELKHNLVIRPIFHQIEAHIFVSFIAYCLLVTLNNLARPQAPGLTPRAIVEKSPLCTWSTSMCRAPTGAI